MHIIPEGSFVVTDIQDGSYLFLPGIVQENGKIYKTWHLERGRLQIL